MKVTLTQAVEGHNALDTVEVDADRAHWLVDHGYATLAKATEPDQDTLVPEPTKALEPQEGDKAVDHTTATDPGADTDPTLAANREAAQVTELKAPGKKASKAEHVAYAEAQGADTTGTISDIRKRLGLD